MQSFQEIWSVCHQEGQAKIKGILANYGLNQETFANQYESLKFNIERENDGLDQNRVNNMILVEMEERLQDEQTKLGTQRLKQSTYKNDGQTRPDEIFNLIAVSKGQRNKGKVQNSAQKDSKNGAHHSTSQSYLNRQSRGQHRSTLNENVARIPGIYNEKAQVEIVPIEAAEGSGVIKSYDFFNLTPQTRTQVLQSHFEEIENLLKVQLKTEAFDEFGLPVADCVRIVGRIVNLSTEDSKLRADTVGILNTSEDTGSTSVFKLKLNLSEVPCFSIFEGEVVVAEGFADANSKFNVNRLFKPEISLSRQLYPYDFLKRCQTMQQQKALSIMVAAGPFTTADSLQYDALRDLLSIVERDHPHTLVLLGPFLDGANTDIKNADICFREKKSQSLVFMDYDDLFEQIMTYIHRFLSNANLRTKVVLIPSAREINHIFPLPQPSYQQMPKDFEPVLLGNPQTFRVNDVTIGVLNADIVKDLCFGMVIKEMKASKIDVALQSVLEQRTFYPLYPGNPNCPIDWEQYRHMMFPGGIVPDILITPSDLMLYAKNIEGVICVNPGMLIKGQAAGSFATITIDPIALPNGDYAGHGMSNKAVERVRVDVINI